MKIAPTIDRAHQEAMLPECLRLMKAGAAAQHGLFAIDPVAVKKAIKAADKVSAWLEAVQIAGFLESEADKFFGRPGDEILRGLEIRLRPPAVVRADYIARHKALLELV